MESNKSFKSEIYCSPLLLSAFKQSAGNRRFIYNQLLNILNNVSKAENKYFTESEIENINTQNFNQDIFDSINIAENEIKYNIYSKKGLQKILTKINSEYDFLTFSHSQSNQESSHSLAKAWNNYLDPKLKNFGRPKFKRKENIQSFYLPNQSNIELKHKNNKHPEIYIKPLDNIINKKLHELKLYKESKKLTKSKIKKLSEQEFLDYNSELKSIENYNKNLFFNSRKITLRKKLPNELKKSNTKITGITIKFDKYNRMFISINYKFINEIEKIIINKKNIIKSINKDKAVGFDMGLKTKLIGSNKEKYNSITDGSNFKKITSKIKKLQK